MRQRGKAAGGRIRPGAPDAQNISFADEEDNVYSRSVDAGHRIDPRAQKIFILVVVLLVVFLFGLLVPKDLFGQAFSYSETFAGYTFAWFVEDLMANVSGLVNMLSGNDDPVTPFATQVIRYVIICLTGAGLALCGAVYQGSFKNALVSPSTLGVMSGAGLGMVVWVVFLVQDDGSNVPWLDEYAGELDTPEYLMSNYSLSLLSFVGCLVVVGAVLLVMKLGGKGGKSAIMLIIAGQVVGSVMGAVSNSVRYYYLTLDPYSPKSQLLTDLAIASFYRDYSWIDLLAVGIPLLATFALVMHMRRRMTMLTFSEEESRSMGVDSRRMQVGIVAVCTLLTAILVSFCGRIGFVGFLVPHLARRLTGPSFSYLLPAATVLGALFVLAAYILVEMTLGPAYETMVGMFISIGGSAVFLVTALQGKGGSRGQFQ